MCRLLHIRGVIMAVSIGSLRLCNERLIEKLDSKSASSLSVRVSMDTCVILAKAST